MTETNDAFRYPSLSLDLFPRSVPEILSVSATSQIDGAHVSGKDALKQTRLPLLQPDLLEVTLRLPNADASVMSEFDSYQSVAAPTSDDQQENAQNLSISRLSEIVLRVSRSVCFARTSARQKSLLR